MKLTAQNINILFAVAITVIGIYAYQVTSENNANKNALESLKTEKEAEVEALKIDIDSISKVAEQWRKAAQIDYEAAGELEEQKEDLKNTEYENEPYTFTDADSLRDVIARRIEKLKGN